MFVFLASLEFFFQLTKNCVLTIKVRFFSTHGKTYYCYRTYYYYRTSIYYYYRTIITLNVKFNDETFLWKKIRESKIYRYKLKVIIYLLTRSIYSLKLSWLVSLFAWPEHVSIVYFKFLWQMKCLTFEFVSSHGSLTVGFFIVFI